MSYSSTRPKAAGLVAVAALAVAGTVGVSHAALADDAVPTQWNYLADAYDGLDSSTVFQEVSYEKLTWILGQPGNHVVVLGGPENATSQNAVPVIDQIAKDNSVATVYHFNPRLGGQLGADITSAGWTTGVTSGNPPVPFPSYAPALWDRLVANALPNIRADYTTDATLLLVANRAAPDPIVASTLAAPNVPFSATGYGAAVQNVFTTAGISEAGASSIDEFTYLQSKYGTHRVDSVQVPYILDSYREDFPLIQLSYPALIALLESPGDHRIFFGGSWCGDTKAALASIIEQAEELRPGEPLYLFDFRIDGATGNYSIHSLETESVHLGLSYLGAKVYQLLGSTHSSWQNTKLTYWENGVYSTDSADLLETSQGKVRFPVLFDFNKELTEGDLAPVRGQWVHQVTEEDVALKAAWDGHVGDYVDYELSTGGLPQSAKDAAVPDLVAFFDLRPPAQGGDDDGGDTPGGDDNGGDTPGGNNSGDNTPGGNNPGTNNPGNTDPGTTNPGTTNPGIVPPVTTPNTDANQPPAGEGKTTLAPVKLRPTVTAKFNKTYTKITVTVKTKAGKGTGKLKVVYKKAGKTKVKYLKLTKGKATYTVTGLKKGQKVRVTYLGTAQVEKKTTSITKK